MQAGSPLIVLLTDFGESEYVGQMKGVLARHCPHARVVDLCHTISPQAVREGAWVLWASYRHFPSGTLFLAVVDPGVGTDRPAVAVESRSYRWVGPDNGLLYPAVTEDGLVRAVRLAVPPQASPTFHGRDVFAPAAGRWAAGESLEALGIPLEQPLVPLHFPTEGGRGEVVRVDRFGNLVTTLPLPYPPERLEGGAGDEVGWEPWLEVSFEGSKAVRLRLVRTYGLGRPGELVAVVGSSGTLELAVVGGSAAERLGVRVGTWLTVGQTEPGPRPADTTGGNRSAGGERGE